ncbi:MAG: YqhA family protein [Thermomicrobiales bacterium]
MAEPSADDGKITTGTPRSEYHDPRDEHPYRRLSGLLSSGRIWIFFSVLGVLLSGIAMLIYALLVVLDIIWENFTQTNFDVDGAKHMAVSLIELTDIFLLGMVLYVVATGMFQLFINKDVPVPSWMRVDNLEELKAHIVNVIMVLLAVTFLADAVDWSFDKQIVYEGAAIAMVIVALSFYSWVNHQKHDDKD